MINVHDLEVIEDFRDVPHGELEWLAAHSEVRHLEVGERFYKQGDPADGLHLILSGGLQLVRREAGQEVNSFLIEPGEISGVLPFSRMKKLRRVGGSLARNRGGPNSRPHTSPNSTPAPPLF